MINNTASDKKQGKQMKQPWKFLSEMGPLAIFFLVYKTHGIIEATLAILVSTVIAVIATYVVEKKIPIMPLISAVVLGIFGGLTVISGDEFFIKIKPTLVNCTFSAILFVGILKGKGLLKNLMDSAINMNDDAWKIFSKRWAFFFLFLAILNEVIWRNFPTDFWVQFKVFGMLTCTIGFTALQVPFLKRNMIEVKS